MPDRDEFEAVFADLRGILTDYAPKLKVVHDKPGDYYLDTHTLGKNKKPIMFAAARIGKAYVSYHFMPVYTGVQGYVACTEKTHARQSMFQLHPA